MMVPPRVCKPASLCGGGFTLISRARASDLFVDDLDRSGRNKIRDRVGMPLCLMVVFNSECWVSAFDYWPMWALPGSEEAYGVILEIRRERTIELVWKGSIWVAVVAIYGAGKGRVRFLSAYFP